MNSPKLRESVERALEGANLEVIDKPTRSYLVKISVFMVNNLRHLILHL